MNLFGWQDDEQSRQIERVAGKISPSIREFLHERGVNGTFHAHDLHRHVGGHVAPASADRILRMLRQAGECDYEVVNRSASFYRITRLG